MANVICPNCGAENKITKHNEQECEYCGTLLNLPKNATQNSTDKVKTTSSNEVMIVDIAPEHQSKEYLESALKSFLIAQDKVPLDIFEHLNIVSTQWVYLPMRRYAGNVTCRWSCTQAVEKKRIRGYRDVKDYNGNTIGHEAEYETYYEYYPRSGTSETSFDTLLAASDYDTVLKLFPAYKRGYTFLDCSKIMNETTIHKYSNKSVSANATIYSENTHSKDSEEMKQTVENMLNQWPLIYPVKMYGA